MVLIIWKQIISKIYYSYFISGGSKTATNKTNYKFILER